MRTKVTIEMFVEGAAADAAMVFGATFDRERVQYLTDAEAADMGASQVRILCLHIDARETGPDDQMPPEARELAPVVSNPPACPMADGWALFNGDEVQRDDEAQMFEDDDAARAHIRGCSACLMSLTVQADGLPVERLLSDDCTTRNEED